MTMRVPHAIDRQTFLANLRQSGLVSAEQWEAVTGSLPDADRGRLLARALVAQGILTKFQAELLLAGRTSGFVLGQYRILDQLGRGGMGRVFKAVHQTLHRVVALKMLAPHLVGTEAAQLLFQREMRAVAQLLHPHIVTAYDANQVGSRCYLVMEYVDGPNLERLIRTQGPLPVELACELMRQAAEGLQYASEVGILHRDIKPANLLVSSGRPSQRHRCTLKILDFGLARLETLGENDDRAAGRKASLADVFMGTPDFISPEQARSLHAADVRSDLYSLGCTFYYLLTGRVPFPGGDTLEKLVRHGTEQPPAVERLRPDLPPAVAATVRRLMAKDPRARFQTPAEFVNALEPFCADVSGSWASAPAPAADVLPTLPFGPAGSFARASPPGDSAWAFVVPPSLDENLAGRRNTVSSGLATTPLWGTRLRRALQSRRATLEERQRVKLALGLAVVIVGGLLGLLSVLFLR